jgi:uncharacterized protein YbjT (DUF2867 family)
VNAVTGALSYTGRAIAEELLARGEQVRSLSRRDEPGDPLRARIDLRPLVFDESLEESLAGVDTLYNTYWIRFERGTQRFDEAVERTIALFEAARRAGVSRVVHISVARADAADDLPYFRGKHRLEQWLRASDLNWAIVRPTLIFGPNDILLNNIAWALRRLPVFLLPGRGRGRVQPVSVHDTARICLDARSHEISDAAGPETFDFRRLVELIAAGVGSRARTVAAPVWAGLAAVRLANLALGDVVVTRDELTALERSLIAVETAPLGKDRFSEWIAANGNGLGRHYASELRRNFRGQE